ncbi:MAG: carotenoid biosynthesis protein [Bacteroidota bacterium]|nr:carotenoid biosynthesis protein [Bacteroidota bacterium]
MRWLRRGVVLLFIVLVIGGASTSPATSDILLLRRYGEMFFLWVAAATIALHPHPVHRQILVGSLIGFASEIVGVATGIPYGVYRYTDTLGTAIAHVPVVMVAAWFVLLSYAWTSATKVMRTLWGARLFAAVLMTAYDLLIDPVAIGPMRLWTWHQDGVYYGVPTVNFFGWFVVSLLALLPVKQHAAEHKPSHWVGCAVVAFFTIVALRSGLVGAAAVGILLLVVDGAIFRTQWVQYFAMRKLPQAQA